MIKDEVKRYFEGDDLATEVFLNKYSLNGKETPDDMHRRLAKEFARIEENYQRNGKEYNPNERLPIPDLSEYGKYRNDLSEESIYNLFKDFKYIVPQGSIMYGLGRNDKFTSLSNCFFIGQPFDSYGGIMQLDEELVQLSKRRGGIGIDISTLRPNSTKVSNAAGSSTGAISFMHRYSNSIREVGQNGRRGALMMTIDVNHPDVLEFAKIKEDLTKVTGANISIKLNKEFMKAVENDEDYFLRFPCDMKLPEPEHMSCDYNKLIEFQPGYVKRIKAKEYFDEFIKQAHKNAEPGLLMWDNVIEYGPDSVYDEYRPSGTNPLT